MNAPPAPPPWLAPALAFTAGFVDVVGFVALFSLFTAHVTGNFVLIGAALVRGSTGGIAAKLLALPMFVLAVAATRLLVARLEAGGRRPLPPLLLIEAALLALFLAAGVAAEPLHDGDAPLALLAGLSGVAAMGVQNATSRLLLSAAPPTTIVTGTTTQIVIDLVDLTHADRARRARARAELVRMAPVLMAFTAGTTMGALGYAVAAFACLSVPLAVLAGLWLVVSRRDL
jgi:uncharacterized membrane protein YoaK (UPF0700 family)